MRKLLVLSFVILIVSCKKTEDVGTPAEFTVVSSSFGDFKADTTINFFDVDLNSTPVSEPKAGDTVIYDYSNLNVKNQFGISFSALGTGDSSLTSAASYFINGIDTFGSGDSAKGINVRNYYQFNASGWYNVGKTIPSVTLSYPAGTITFPAQSIVYSSGLFLTKLPLYYKDSIAVDNVTAIDSFKVSITPLNIVDSPGTRITSHSYKLVATGRGILKLKGFTDAMEVIVVKHKAGSVQTNYTLGGGQPGDTTLSTTFGLQEEIKATNPHYDFYTRAKGYMGTVEMNETGTTVTRAYFRKNF